MSDGTRAQRLLKIGLWTLGAIVAVVALAVAALAASIAIAGSSGQAKLAEVTNTTIPGDGGPDVRAYVARPEGPGPHPAVIMVHEFWGLNPEMVEKADLLASEGFVVVAPNVFRSGTTDFLPRAIYQTITTPPEEINEDLDATVAWIRADSDVDAERVGITGFCFGGRTSLLFSLHNPTLQATSIFYGNPVTDPVQLATLPGPVLGEYGGADVSIPLEDVDAFERALAEAGVESTITVYPDQPHAFVKGAEGIATDPVQRAAWEQMVEFFRATLADDSGSTQQGDAPAGRSSEKFGFTAGMRLGIGHIGHPTPWDTQPNHQP